MASKTTRDPVHGLMELPHYCWKIIDTPEFQRLRHIRQLGIHVQAVYPSANHDRFTHSLGTSYLAGKVIRMLKEKQKSLDITDDDIKVVEIAGLCHDLGHGPFSHSFEKVTNTMGIKWKHEQASVAILKAIKEKVGLTDEELTMICNIINGTPPEGEKKKKFLYQIVSNEPNGIDVDKWDYFGRDALHLGLSIDFDYRYLLNFLRVVKVEGDTYEIGFRDKEKESIAALFTTRWKLHAKAYQHRVSALVEQMTIDVLVEYFNWTKKLSGDETKGQFVLSKIFESHQIPVNNVRSYCQLDDRILHKISLSENEELEKARDLLTRIDNRRHYRMIAEFQETDEENKVKQDDKKEMIDKLLKENYTSDELVTVQHKINFGKGNKDPLKDVYFFRKGKDEIPEGLRLPSNQMPITQPRKIQIKIYRIYTRREDLKGDELKKLSDNVKCAIDPIFNQSTVETVTDIGDRKADETTPEKRPPVIARSKRDQFPEVADETLRKSTAQRALFR